METLAFMKIITGEEPISYFDIFTESWKKEHDSGKSFVLNMTLFL